VKVPGEQVFISQGQDGDRKTRGSIDNLLQSPIATRRDDAANQAIRLFQVIGESLQLPTQRRPQAAGRQIRNQVVKSFAPVSRTGPGIGKDNDVAAAGVFQNPRRVWSHDDAD
jgi:hypothetical protein